MSWSTSSSNLLDWTPHEQLREWVFDRIRHFRPARVHLCDGSDAENEALLTNMVHSGLLIRLNEKLRPNSYVARSTASDVARIEERTFICSENKSDAGFTNNWKDPEEMQATMNRVFDGCMKGRTMYVIPFCMGPLNGQQPQPLLPPYHSLPSRVETLTGSAVCVLCSVAADAPVTSTLLHCVGLGSDVEPANARSARPPSAAAHRPHSH
jgi:hypothetical protein